MLSENPENPLYIDLILAIDPSSFSKFRGDRD